MSQRQRPETSVGAIVVKDAKLLLIQRGREPALGLWSVPGGRVEGGETLAEAVVREVAEETGLEVVCGHFVGFVERIGPTSHYVILDFWARVVGNQPLQAGDDAAEAAWVRLDELHTVDLVDSMLDFLIEHGVVDPCPDSQSLRD
ncbi:MAG: NUDIX hydrolase [Actinomycetia bacterium]|nr:NUDIX hydrolase [Actinomycetes bacterium]